MSLSLETNPGRVLDTDAADAIDREDRAAAADIVTFLERAIEKAGISAIVVESVKQWRGSVVRVHVGVDDKRLNIGERAELLQRIEDLWNEQEPRPALSVIIEPATTQIAPEG